MTDEYDFLKDVAEAGATSTRTLTLPTCAHAGQVVRIRPQPGESWLVSQPTAFEYDLGPNFILTREIFEEIYNAGRDMEASFCELNGSPEQVARMGHHYEELLKKYNLEKE